MMTHLLKHPALQTLEPENDREMLLFIKAHTLGLEAALTAVRLMGLQNTEAIYRQNLPKMSHNLDTLVRKVTSNM